MVKAKKSSSSSSARGKSSPKPQKRKPLAPAHPPQRGGVELVDPRVQAQMKLYDEALGLFHQQKFQRAKQELEKILEGPSKELADRARMHIRIAEQRMKPSQEQNPRTPEDHYQRGVAMMNLGRWDDARRCGARESENRDRTARRQSLPRPQRRRFCLPPGRSSLHRTPLSRKRRRLLALYRITIYSPHIVHGSFRATLLRNSFFC